MEDWKRHMGYLPAVCGFPPGIVQELPRMIQMPAAISRQTEKQMMQNSQENISMSKRALGIIIMVSIHFKLNDLWHSFYGFIKLKWQENMRGSLRYINTLTFMRLHPVAEHIIFPLLNILLKANWKIQSLCMQIFNWPSAYESWHSLVILITQVSSRVSAGVSQTIQVHRWKRDVLVTQYVVYFSLSGWFYYPLFPAVNPLIIFDIVSTRSPLFIMSEQPWAHRWSH